MTVIVWGPDGSALFNYGEPAITSTTAGTRVGSVEVLEPGERIRTRYEGAALYLEDPRAMKDPGKAFERTRGASS